jgi:hypothetical protein
MVSNRIRVLIFSLATLVGLGNGASAVLAADKAKAEKKEQPSTFKLLHTLKGLAKDFDGGMSFSPDGKLLVSAADTRLCLWDVASGKLIREVDLKAGWIFSPRFVLGGRCVVCGVGDYKGDVQRFDVPSLNIQGRDKLDAAGGRDLNHLTASADGKYLSYEAGLDIGVWDLANRKRLWQVRASPVRKTFAEGLKSVRFEPRGKFIAVALEDGAIKLHAIRDGKVSGKLLNPNMEYVESDGTDFSPDGKNLAVGIWAESLIRVWDIESGEIRRTIRWGSPRPTDLWKTSRNDPRYKVSRGLISLAFSPDGKAMAVLCADEKMRIWETATGSLRCEVITKGNELVFAPNGRTIATSIKGNIKLWDWWNQSRSHPYQLAAKSEILWRQMAAKDAIDAFRAMCILVESPNEAVELLRTRLRDAPSISTSRLERLFTELDADTYVAREKATRELAALGIAVERKLRDLLTGSPSLEVRRRAGILLKRLPADGGREHVRWRRAVEVLGHIGTRDAEKVLARLAAGTPGLTQTEEARSAMERIAMWRQPQR